MKDNKDSPFEVKGGDASPILKTWRNVYIFVTGVLLFLIVLFYALTLYFA